MYKKIFFLVLSLCFLTITIASPVPRHQKFHGSEKNEDCIKCHIKVPSEAGDPTGKAYLRFNGNIDKICSECHGDYKHVHPIKLVISPTIKGTESLPLDSDGKIICITCHDVMEKISAHRKKMISGKKLCLSCHVDSDIFAQIIWYPTHLKKGETGRLEIKVVEFNLSSNKKYIGETVLLYYYAKDIDTGEITFGTNILYDDETHGDRVKGDSIYTLTETAQIDGKMKRLVYTGWIFDSGNKRSNTVTLAIEYEK